MKPEPERPSLQSLEEDIRRLQSKVAPRRAAPPQGMQAALRMGLELAAGVLVGAGVGMLLDRWLGTSPVLCIVCFFLGAGGGFLTLYRTATAMDREGEAGVAANETRRTDVDVEKP